MDVVLVEPAGGCCPLPDGVEELFVVPLLLVVVFVVPAVFSGGGGIPC